MKITIESTSKVVQLEIDGVSVPARIWQGKTDSGVPVQCYVTRICPEIETTDSRLPKMIAQFERELRIVAPPRAAVEAIPLRMIL